ncbi:MAG TPA: hypothetical protein DCS93_06585 [Microscillaceae bacterium]|nr:hypothetical protein [Microscillaceae bacterium]
MRRFSAKTWRKIYTFLRKTVAIYAGGISSTLFWLKVVKTPSLKHRLAFGRAQRSKAAVSVATK